jgi:propionyl-CoA carboxylase alpha chain
MISKILVANRGEIAIRVMQTAKRMGIRTVAVYSDADKHALHVSSADEAFYIGPSPSAASYLNQEKIIETTLIAGADAIHPGYGFLSENADFAAKVADNGIIFIGPGPASINTMGSKLAAKEAVRAFNIPMVPGSDHPIRDPAAARSFAREIGFPVLIKASAGGGGKGMRIVEREEVFEKQMERAVSEALSSFGDGSVFIEKYITSPRHIEIQILADQFGNVIHLFERECSIQRRHQKVIEEAPSAVMTPALRKKMGQDAIQVAKACNYTGAGTVEFLVDSQMNYYFLEMNTRLQVEHPVTEMITGIDLVEHQINIASGEPLALRQEELRIQGHSIELRVYAEDPTQDFLPSLGSLNTYIIPKGNGIRVDGGFEQGMEIPIFYDPMLSKLIVYDTNRQSAIAKMLTAIDHYHIEGVVTTLDFGKYAFAHPAFISGNFDTHFIDRYYLADLKANEEKNKRVAALLAAKLQNNFQAVLKAPDHNHVLWKVNRTQKK